MARHNIYTSDDVEQLVDELGLAGDGWSELFTRGLTALLATLPEAKVRRAAGRVARRQAQARVELLLPARNAD